MANYIMFSGPNRDCENCQDATADYFCPSCQYAYWSDRPEANNWDCPHATGVSEAEARRQPEMAEAVASADS